MENKVHVVDPNIVGQGLDDDDADDDDDYDDGENPKGFQDQDVNI